MDFDADQYRDYRDSIIGPAVAEPDLFAGDPAMTPELVWQSRWFAGEFGRDFTGVDGEAVEIREFGWWNRSAGPDFVETVVAINGEIHRGGIELDTDARDWERHGHATNPLYDKVTVHLFFKSPTSRFFTRTSANRNVVQVCLPVPAQDDRMREAALRLGRCARPFAAMPIARVEAFLTGAARHRAEEKARRFLRVASLHGRSEAWFQALAESLGYHANREPMRMLAQRLPLRLLASLPADAEGMLFGHAGFLEERPFDDAGAPAARAYLRALWQAWWKHRDESVRHLQWNHAGLRPANHPHRRVAVLAMLVARWEELLPMLEAADLAGLRKQFDTLGHGFWSHHFTLAAGYMDDPVALAGPDRVNDLIGNFVLPVRAQSDPGAWQAYENLKSNQTSRSVLRAAERLLGGRRDAKSLLRSFSHQQGLLQVYRDFCLNDTSACEDCLFPGQLARWPDA